MKNKNKANQSASQKRSRIDDTCTDAQRDRLKAWLEQCAVETLYARDELNIMQPAARIKELREAGHPIKTQRITLTDAQGRTHRGIALYYLSSVVVAND